MPLVQIDLPRPLFAEKGSQISEEIHLRPWIIGWSGELLPDLRQGGSVVRCD
jgi:hypothetical protein